MMQRFGHLGAVRVRSARNADPGQHLFTPVRAWEKRGERLRPTTTCGLKKQRRRSDLARQVFSKKRTVSGEAV
jgi:hypothetical protein